MSSNKKTPAKPVYETLSQVEHILKRPDMYIGSVKNKESDFYGAVVDSGLFKISLQQGMINDGLHRLFIEILSNAIDNFWRSEKSEEKQTKIHVTVDKTDGRISVWNNGQTIPVEIDSKSGVYNPEMIFGQLMSGSNFDDEKERFTSGLHGLGSTLTNIFSKEFTIDLVDTFTGQSYTQTWRENMSKKETPTIKKSRTKTGYTKVIFTPDYKKFGVNGLNDAMISLMLKNVVDSAMITGIQVTFNDEKIPIKGLKDYSLTYFSQEVEHLDVLYIETKDCKVSLIGCDQPSEQKVVSFVNGIHTKDGGVHVDVWLDALLRPVLEKLNKAIKGKALTMRDVKPHFNIFINCLLDKPTFTSQEKIKLSSPSPTVEVATKHINAIMKFSVIENIKNSSEVKDLLELKKIENKNKSFKKIEKYEKANNAGGKHAGDCCLMLCEGDSAKTFCMSGLSTGVYGRKGRDWFGIYPLKGVPMNTRDKKADVIAKNKELRDIIQILNLKTGVDYSLDENFKTLTYGRVILLGDADVDSYHIIALIINFFHCLYPSLLKRKFLLSMRTPIIRLKLSKNILDFYTQKDFRKYLSENPNPRGDIKYYKGLGTSTSDEVVQVFGKKMIEFVEDKDTDDNMNKVFNSKLASRRKEWVSAYDPNLDREIVSKDPEQRLNISDFLNNEMILFSIDDNKRSIPSVVDGLKESQRKILFGCFLKNLTKECKVAQLAGFIAEKTGYHHGEASLNETIVKMAQNFTGSNNIPYLTRGGQFGSLAELGKDAASPRYIFTALEKITEVIFNREDEAVYTQLEDDGDKIEWEYFVPIIPMVLVNGATGIGSGFSVEIPLHNPKDVISIIKKKLNKVDIQHEELIPWYRGFKGVIEKSLKKNQYITKGIVKRENKKVVITCIPVGMSINTFREFLDDLLEEKKIKGYNNYSNENDVHFEITESDQIFTLESLKLTSTLSTNNMVLFDRCGKLKKYDSAIDIIEDFFVVRLEYYIKRKAHLLSKMKLDLKVLQNKFKFLGDMIVKKINIDKLSDQDLLKVLSDRYDKMKDSDESGGCLSDYSYLLNMNIRSFTEVKMDKLEKDIKKLTSDIKSLEETTPEKMWLKELEKLSGMISD